MSAPLVSVLLPLLPSAPDPMEAVRGVLAQTYEQIELIILQSERADVQVPEATPQDLQASRDPRTALQDPRVQKVPTTARTLPRALNEALPLCKGEFVTWVSRNGFMMSRCIEILLRTLLSMRRAGAVYANYDQIDGDGQTLRRISKGQYRLNGRMGFGPAFLLRRSAFDRVGNLDEKLGSFAERDFAIRLAIAMPVLWVPHSLYKERVSPSQGALEPAEMQDPRHRSKSAFRHKWEGLLYLTDTLTTPKPPQPPRGARSNKRSHGRSPTRFRPPHPHLLLASSEPPPGGNMQRRSEGEG